MHDGRKVVTKGAKRITTKKQHRRQRRKTMELTRFTFVNTVDATFIDSSIKYSLLWDFRPTIAVDLFLFGVDTYDKRKRNRLVFGTCVNSAHTFCAWRKIEKFKRELAGINLLFLSFILNIWILKSDTSAPFSCCAEMIETHLCFMKVIPDAMIHYDSFIHNDFTEINPIHEYKFHKIVSKYKKYISICDTQTLDMCNQKFVCSAHGIKIQIDREWDLQRRPKSHLHMSLHYILYSFHLQPCVAEPTGPQKQIPYNSPDFLG